MVNYIFSSILHYFLAWHFRTFYDCNANVLATLLKKTSNVILNVIQKL